MAQHPNPKTALADQPLPVSPELAAAWEKWHDWLLYVKQLSPHTLRAYRHDVAHFIHFYSSHLGDEIGFEALSYARRNVFHAWLAKRAMKDQVSATSRARHLAGVRHFYQWLDRQGYLHNAHARIVRQRVAGRPLPKPVDAHKAKNMILNEDVFGSGWQADRDRALMALLYGAGLRLGEALALDCRDWPSGGESLRVIGKGGKQRDVHLLEPVLDAMSAYFEAAPYPVENDRPLFVGARGKRLNPSIPQKLIRQLRNDPMVKLPTRATPHSMRHAFATHLLINGTGLRAIQELLGHSSLSATQRYTELEIEDLRATLEACHPRGK